MFKDRLAGVMIDACGADPRLPIVVGVSGGLDSMCLMHSLREAGFKLIVGHLDHALRERSAAQAAALGEAVEALNLPFYTERQDVADFALRYKLGIEEAARLCRYHFLFSLAREHGAQGVAVGHQADDQVETVLMHFLRGSGLGGLSGMQPRGFLRNIDPDLPVFRPLLGVTRQEIEQYCQSRNLAVLEDESNIDLSFFRNRLRHEVIPLLEGCNSGLRKALTRAAASISADRDLLEQLSREAYARLQKHVGADYLVFDKAGFLAAHLSLRRNVLRIAFSELKPNTRDLGFEAVERALSAIGGAVQQIPFAGGLWVFTFEEEFVVAPATYRHNHHDYPQLPDGNEFRLQCGDRLSLSGGWELSASLVDARRYKRLPDAVKGHPLHAWLNPLDLELPLEVRSMRAGERWSPLGMVHKHQKMSDFFVNQKIPRSARARWPLVLSGGSVLWVAGLRIAQAWRLTGSEPEVLHLQLHPPK